MNSMCRKTLISAALASLLSLSSSLVFGDSLVTTDGDMLLGSVTKTSTGYTVQTADGPVDIAADRVKKVLYDHPPATPAPTAAAQPTISPTTPTAKLAEKAGDSRMLNALIGQGQVAYGAGEFGDARDAFTDALALDPKNAVAGRGLGFSYLKLNKPAKAVKPLELDALNQQPMDRALTLGLSSALVVSHNPARAAKILKTYLDAHPTPSDEPMLNALGVALSQVDRSATHSTLFTDSVKLYTKLNADLEVNKKQKARDNAQKKVDTAWNKLQTAINSVATAQSNLSSVSNSSARRNVRDAQVNQAQSELNIANNDQEKAQNAYDDASKVLADLPAPDFPTVIAIDDVDLSLNPNAVVASVIPSTPSTPTDPPVSPSRPLHHKRAAQPADTVANNDPSPVTPTAADQTPRHVTRYAVAFAIAPDVLVTAASAVEDATDIHVIAGDGKSFKAQVLRAHHADGIALLKVDGGTFPCLALADSADGGAGSMTCLGFPEVDLFNPMAKSMTVAGGGQTDSWTVRFDLSPRLPGGPLISGNAVVGVELGDRDSDLAEVPAATLKALQSLAQDIAHADPKATDPKQAVMQVSAER
jgi:tetratricopeptide (TPR) repeat protein